jgi:benzoyl-CoA reductase subunit BamC
MLLTERNTTSVPSAGLPAHPSDALTYEEREEEVEEEEEKEELEIGLEALVDKFGLDKIMDTVARMSVKE